MAMTWWQRLRRPETAQATSRRFEPTFGFRLSDDTPSGWWLRAESRPVRAGIRAAAKAVPLILSAWTYNVPQPEEPPVPRGAERLALLCKLGSEFAA
jgi:hypothetical protein